MLMNYFFVPLFCVNVIIVVFWVLQLFIHVIKIHGREMKY